MSTTVLADMNEAMKVIFADPIVENYTADSELMDWFESDVNVQTDVTTGGRYVETAQYFALPAAVRSAAEGDYIPVPGAPNFKNSRIYLRKILGALEMSGDVMRRVATDIGAFIDYAERALGDLSTRTKNELDRQYIGAGFGHKARVAGAIVDNGGGSYTIPIDASLGVDGFEDAWLMFLEGESIVFAGQADGDDLRNPGAQQSFLVLDLDEAAGTLTGTMSAALAAAIQTNDYIASGDQSGVAFQKDGENREVAGLLAAVDDGGIVLTYNNIARDTNRLWRSIVIDASADPWNGQMSERLLVYADEEVRQKGQGKIDAMVMSMSAARGYWLSLKSDRFFVDPRAYFGGKGGLEVILGDRTLPIRTARKLPPQLVFGVERSSFRRITLGSWTWDDKTGSIWNRVSDSVGRKDAYYAVGYAHEELFNVAPRHNFRLDGLANVQ